MLAVLAVACSSPLRCYAGQMLAPPHSLQWIRLLLLPVMMICVWAGYYKQMIRPLRLPCYGAEQGGRVSFICIIISLIFMNPGSWTHGL